MAAEDSPEKTGLRSAWGRVAIEYGDLWEPRTIGYTEQGLDLLDAGPDGAGLDVACGPGRTAAALADRLVAGTTLGVDFSEQMVERAGARFSDRPGLSFAADDAEHLSLADRSFDYVTCSLGLMYCYDAQSALRHMSRVLLPGGRLMLVVWGRAADVWWSPVIELIETRAAYYSAICPMIFFYGLPGVLPRMLADHGLEARQVETIDEPMRFGSLDEALDAAILGCPLAGLFRNRLDQERQREVRQGLQAHLEAVADVEQGGVALPAQVTIAVAERAGSGGAPGRSPVAGEPP